MEVLWDMSKRGRVARRNVLEASLWSEIFAYLLPNHSNVLHRLAIALFSIHLYLRPSNPSVRIDLNDFSSSQCKDLFRFYKEDLHVVIGSLWIPTTLTCRNGSKFQAMEGFLIMTYRLAYPKRLIEMQQMFFRSEDDLSRIFNSMIIWILERWQHLLAGKNICIVLDSIKCYNNILEQHTAIHPFPIFGFLDGTLRPCARPKIFQQSIYNGMDRVHGLKYLVVQVPDGMIGMLLGPFEGARHDSWCYKKSKMEMILEERIGSQHQLTLYGDQGFPNSGWVLSSYRGSNLSPQQNSWNNSINACRICVEWGIGKVASLWASNNLKEQQRILSRRIGPMYQIAVSLTNIHTTLYHSLTGQYFKCVPPTLQQYLSDDYT